MANARTVARSCGPKSFNISLQTSNATVHLACCPCNTTLIGRGSIWWLNALSQAPTLSTTDHEQFMRQKQQHKEQANATQICHGKKCEEIKNQGKRWVCFWGGGGAIEGRLIYLLWPSPKWYLQTLKRRSTYVCSEHSERRKENII